MILEIVAVLAFGSGAYLVGTKKGKADLAALKVDLKADLAKVEASVASVDAKIKADVLALVAKIKAL